MEGHYFQLKKFHIPESIGLTFHGFDLVIPWILHGVIEKNCETIWESCYY